MLVVSWFGFIGAVCSTIAFVPQVVKMARHRSSTMEKDDGLSSVMLMIQLVGMSHWVAYAVLQRDTILLVSKSIAGSLVLMMLLLHYRKTPPCKCKPTVLSVDRLGPPITEEEAL